MTAATLPADVWERVRDDTPFYVENLAHIVDKHAALIVPTMRPSQRKVEAALAEQQELGLPMRAIVLKSRKTGVSTYIDLKCVQRCTTRPNQRALIVAQDNDTAGELFDIAHTAYVNLPGDYDVRIKPKLAARNSNRGGKLLHWGTRQLGALLEGDVGVNSTLKIDTADVVDAGRGKTITFLHCSEVAFWRDPRKALALLNAVPDEPETCVVLESTANGHNFFKGRWDRALRGEGHFAPVFIGWLEDPDCRRAFPDAETRATFEDRIGTGSFGEDEPDLIARGATSEQLYWRRGAIVDKCEGKVELFKQEYPSTPEEAFIASGKHRFSIVYISRALEATAVTDPKADIGLLTVGVERIREVGVERIAVPESAVWVPKQATGFAATHDFWRVWEHPVKREVELDRAADEEGYEPRQDGQYVVALDPAGGEENTTGEGAWSAIQVIDHRTREQVASYRSRKDSDEMALEALLVAIYYNRAWLAVEATGGWASHMLKLLYRRWAYGKIYRRISADDPRDRPREVPGWSTDRKTKPWMEENFAELLREGTHGLRCRQTALELTTYIRDERSGAGRPDDEAFSDLLMAYMIAQLVANLKRVVPVDSKPHSYVGAASRTPASWVTGRAR